MAALLLCITGGGGVRAQDNSEISEIQSAVALFEESIEVLKNNYVDKVDHIEVTERALKAMFASLDGHSAYMNAREYRAFDENITGQFAGIGVVLESTHGVLRVVSSIDGGPAARAGVGSGWEITRIGELEVEGMLLHEAVGLLRGEQGHAVEVSFRTPQDVPVLLSLTREIILTRSVQGRKIGAYGYIRITQFQRRTGIEFAEAISSLSSQGPLPGLILDLRNNHGGFVDEAVSVASYLLAPGNLVVSQGKTQQDALHTRVQTSDQRLADIPVIVLTNGSTVSAAEILAGALQDNGRAQIVGLTSFGKGLVQTVFPLKGGANGAISITTLRYYTPGGRSIQGVGIVPDLTVARTACEARDAVAKDNITPSEASLANALPNDQRRQREPSIVVEGPPELDPQGDCPVANSVEQSSDEIVLASDFQLRRAVDIFEAGSIAAAQLTHPATFYRSEDVASPSSDEK